MTKTNVKVQLSDKNGNAWAILGRVTRALKKAGHKDLVKAYQEEAMSGDYNHLLQITSEYVEVS